MHRLMIGSQLMYVQLGVMLSALKPKTRQENINVARTNFFISHYLLIDFDVGA